MKKYIVLKWYGFKDILPTAILSTDSEEDAVKYAEIMNRNGERLYTVAVTVESSVK